MFPDSFLSKIMQNNYCEKISLKIGTLVCHFIKKLSTVNNHPFGEISHNLVTLMITFSPKCWKIVQSGHPDFSGQTFGQRRRGGKTERRTWTARPDFYLRPRGELWPTRVKLAPRGNVDLLGRSWPQGSCPSPGDKLAPRGQVDPQGRSWPPGEMSIYWGEVGLRGAVHPQGTSWSQRICPSPGDKLIPRGQVDHQGASWSPRAKLPPSGHFFPLGLNTCYM
jgi:hypothetical protein